MAETNRFMPTGGSDRVPWKTRLGWGAGGLADNYIMNAITPHILIMPIYNLVFGLDPIKIGIALSVPRFVDAITDPLMGNISDNTRSRLGRRKPYIVIGAILSAVLIPFLWLPPVHTETFLFIYLMVMATLISLAYTVYAVPYTAMGFELTPDYDEKTRVLAWRMYIGLIGSLTLPWAYRAIQMEIFGGNLVRGAVAVSVVAGVIIIIFGLMPAVMGSERSFVQQQNKIGIVQSMCKAFENRSFAILLIAYLVILVGIFSVSNLGLYLNIYYVCGGNKVFAGTLTGLMGTQMALTSYLSLPLITWISLKTSKRIAMVAGLVLASFGTSLTWFTITPEYPYLQLVSVFIIGLGLQGCWLMVSTMTADVCDDEELKTGLRREGVYGAVISFTLKVALAATAVTAGVVLTLSGYDTETANLTGEVSNAVIFRMRLLIIVVQSIPMLIAASLFLRYPITRQRAEETQRLLKARHSCVKAEKH